MGESKKSGPKKGKKGKKTRLNAFVPLGIGSHHTAVEDFAIFGDYTFKRTSTGNYTIRFRGAGCQKKEWPPPVIFTNETGDRYVRIQGWSCKKGDFIAYVTSEDDGLMADYDFDWIVYRG
jgi:hypothetical protein